MITLTVVTFNQGCKSTAPSVRQTEDKAPSTRVLTNFKDENVNQWDRPSKRVIDTLNVERQHSKIQDPMEDSVVPPMSTTEKSLKCDNMREPRRFEVESEARDVKERLICSADV